MIRRCRFSDLMDIQNLNLRCLPENYQNRYFQYHGLLWPQMLYVSEDHNGKVNGYVLAKTEEEEEDLVYGHVTSLAVTRSTRKTGVARRLMEMSMTAADKVFNGQFMSLSVRCTNEPALTLYQSSLGYKVHAVCRNYYGDNEDAYEMRKCFFMDDPLGATINRYSTSINDNADLQWPQSNPAGVLKLENYILDGGKIKVPLKGKRRI